MLPANRLHNVRRRAYRAMESKHGIHTCPASRHLLIMADELAAGRKYHMFDEDPKHCAGGMFAVVEALWKARAEVKRLKNLNSPTAGQQEEK